MPVTLLKLSHILIGHGLGTHTPTPPGHLLSYITVNDAHFSPSTGCRIMLISPLLQGAALCSFFPFYRVPHYVHFSPSRVPHYAHFSLSTGCRIMLISPILQGAAFSSFLPICRVPHFAHFSPSTECRHWTVCSLSSSTRCDGLLTFFFYRVRQYAHYVLLQDATVCSLFSSSG
jgi:hypothetical protein